MEDRIFGYYIDRAIKAIRADLTRRFKKNGIDLTPEQWVIMFKIYEKDGSSQNELADGSYKNAATVSRIIDLLHKKSYCERKPSEEDRRKFQIYLTAEGKAIVEKALPVVWETRKRGWRKLSDEDYDTFIRIIDQVFENYRTN